MINNTPNASFSLVSYIFDKIIIDLSVKGDNELSLKFECKGIYTESELNYELIFSVQVKSEDKKVPFITIQCKGLFHFQDSTSFESIPAYFYANSIAILFPYLRSYVSLVTTQANISGVILPTLNLSSLGDELKRNTISN